MIKKYTKEYRLWYHIKERCYNINCKDYSDYGYRGIKMYQDWIFNFKAFYDYLQTLSETREEFEARTGGKATLDRINVNLGYGPGNIRWASQQEQQQNRSNNVLDEELVKHILWQNQINKLGPSDIYRLLQYTYTGSKSAIERVIRKQTWTNVNIDKEISEFRKFGTVNGFSPIK